MSQSLFTTLREPKGRRKPWIIPLDCGHRDDTLTGDSRPRCSSTSWTDAIKRSLSLKRLRGSPLGRFVIFNLHWRGFWCYCSIIPWNKCSGGWKKLWEGRESEKSPGKSPALSLPVPLTHLNDFQSPEPICWERNPTLARNETTSTSRHIPSPQHHPSLPLRSLLYSPLCRLPAHQRSGRETRRLSRSPFRLPTFHFVPNLYSSLL